MSFIWRTDYQHMQPQEVDPRFTGEKKLNRKGVLFGFTAAAILLAALIILTVILSKR